MKNLANFPNDKEPDGDRFLPHHHYTGMGVIAIGSSMVGAGAVKAMLTAVVFFGVFAMATVWTDEINNYPKVGAVVSVGAGFLAFLIGMLGTSALPALMITVGALISLDDTLEHAFGYKTPIDRTYRKYIRPRITQW